MKIYVLHWIHEALNFYSLQSLRVQKVSRCKIGWLKKILILKDSEIMKILILKKFYQKCSKIYFIYLWDRRSSISLKNLETILRSK